MDILKSVLNEVTMKLQGQIDEDAIKEVQSVLSIVLYDYDLSKKSNELIVSDADANENYLSMFLASKQIEGKSKGTIKRYKFVVDKLLCHVDKSVLDMTVNDIRYFLAIYKKNNSNTTMDGMRRCLSSFFNWLENEDYILKNPVRKLAKIKNDTIKENHTPALTWKLCL